MYDRGTNIPLSCHKNNISAVASPVLKGEAHTHTHMIWEERGVFLMQSLQTQLQKISYLTLPLFLVRSFESFLFFSFLYLYIHKHVPTMKDCFPLFGGVFSPTRSMFILLFLKPPCSTFFDPFTQSLLNLWTNFSPDLP